MPLRSRIEVYISCLNGVDKHGDIEKWIQMVVEKFRDWFQNVAVREEVTYKNCTSGSCTTGVLYVVWSFCTTKQLQEHFLSVDAIVRNAKERIGCDDVSVAINGSMYLYFDDDDDEDEDEDEDMWHVCD